MDSIPTLNSLETGHFSVSVLWGLAVFLGYRGGGIFKKIMWSTLYEAFDKILTQIRDLKQAVN